MKQNVIVSLADANYFDLLNELVDSIQIHEKSRETAICILDAGLSKDQKNILSKKVDEIKSAEWDIEVSAIKVRGKEWLKSQVSRAFLPKYFPNYEKYLWIDCDAWVNDWQSVELYFKACEKSKLGITQTIGPGYKVKDKEWLKSQVSRAFLPRYFPNYDKYLWIDCDAWVNDWQSVELYFKACENGKLGITQTIGPGYRLSLIHI